jgi:hypothetical protein
VNSVMNIRLTLFYHVIIKFIMPIAQAPVGLPVPEVDGNEAILSQWGRKPQGRLGLDSKKNPNLADRFAELF